MKHSVGLLVDDRYLRHAISLPSLENPERLRIVADVIRERYQSRCRIMSARDVTLADLETMHSRFYLDQIVAHQERPDPYSYDKDTYIMDQSLAVAQLAVGGCLELADRIMAGDVRQGFALIRPPGHHAEPGRGMGFCIVNNVALTAEYLQRVYGLSRILIVDFDAHHGNGTQECFYDTDEVLFVSLHQRDIFPFTGSEQELGEGRGLGFTINIPVYSQFGDQEYTFLMGRMLQAIVEQYLPQIILVSAGYDGHVDDTISNTRLSTSWFGTVTTMMQQYAEEACNGKLLMVLEGGYNPTSLAESILTTIDALLLRRNDRIGVMYSSRAATLLKNHPCRQYWTI